MIEEWTQSLVELILDFGSFVNNIIMSAPSKLIPFFTPNLVLIIISILFGYFFGKKAKLGFKTFSIILLSILFYGFMRWIGCG